ncbi:CAP domain-containing protein [Anabaena sp. CS-542/02]|uniref:CAP domain-containing protein n=1 Tax=Anabaena sp. CS-542/02 TaxID=3021719 RepID=UPI00232B29D2|nr:CAP domain-containing protein [Anabaena sp. CS-542/02]MDB9447965.1 CAP domain-containing protein [Anabaena sp. CS-542/02]
MFRQPAFGIALSTLVLASGLINTSITSHGSTESTNRSQPLLIPPSQAAILTTTTSIQTNALEKSVFEKINQYRVSQNLPKLRLNTDITEQARIHSQDMANGKVPFSHEGFKQRVSTIPLRHNGASENLALNKGYSNPASEAITGWLKSPGHLQNIHGDYDLTGIGVATNKEGEVYLTQIFIRSK